MPMPPRPRRSIFSGIIFGYSEEIFGCHVTSISILMVSLTFIASTLLAGATAFVPLNLNVLVAVITIAIVEITTCGMHIIAIRETASRMLIPNLIVSTFNILFSIGLFVLSIIDITSGDQVMGSEVLILVSPASLAMVDTTGENGEVTHQLSNSAPLLTVSILLSTLFVITTVYNIGVLLVHLRCYRFLTVSEQQYDQWDNQSTGPTVSMFATLDEEYDRDSIYSIKKQRLGTISSMTSIKEEDEDDFYYRYLTD